MNTATALLAEARSRGLILTVNGPKISYTSTREAVASDLIDRLREHKAELLKLLAAESVAPAGNGEAEGAGRPLHTNYGAGYRHPDGSVEPGQPEPMPRPVASWPADLDTMLRRVSTAFEWTDTDRRDFVSWARRSPDGLRGARVFLQSECDALDIRMVMRGGRLSA